MTRARPEVDTGKVLTERRGHVLVITLNRPGARNAVDHDVCHLVGSALHRADADPGVRCIVITGAGDAAFCAGLDLKALARGDRILPQGMEHWNFAGFVRHFVDTPTIAAVNGAAMGGGTEIALACDLVVAAETARFGLPEVKRGLLAAAGGVFRITDALPRKVALELLLTGDPISAAEAARWGLVNRVVPAGGALTGALELAERITGNAPLAVQASKRLAHRLRDGEPLGEPELWDATEREIVALLRSEDAQEGPRAFAEKRAPVWKGR